MEGINDVFIQNASGIPYIARCYGGNYCQTAPDHELVTGFFAALNSFKGELGQKELDKVRYDQISLVFESKDELLVVCNIDNNVDDETFRDICITLRDEYYDRFGDSAYSATNKELSDYTDWMDKQIGQGMADLKPAIESRTSKGGLLTRIKSWLI